MLDNIRSVDVFALAGRRASIPRPLNYNPVLQMLSCLRHLCPIAATLLFALPLAPNPLTLDAPARAQSPDAINPIPTKNRKAEADRLFQQGVSQFRSGQFRDALQTYQKVLKIRRKLGEKAAVAETLTHIGEAYNGLSDFEKALETLQQALAIHREVNNPKGEGETLDRMGFAYRKLGEYARSLELHQQALEIAKKTGDRSVEAESLHNIAAVHNALGEYDKALELYEQALAIREEVGDRIGYARTLNNLAGVYEILGDSDKALESYEQALAIRKELGDRAGVGRILNNIGYLYRQQAEYSKALEFYQQALPILQEIGDRASINSTLNSIGAVYESIGKYPQALTSYQQAWEIAKEINDKPGARKALSNMGFVLARQNQPELGIIFYKQAVNITEAIRQDLKQLTLEQQQSYTETVSDTYRSLADLLLQQNRVIEAQQVLDLLKVEELNDYLQNVQGNDQTVKGIELLPEEKRLLENYKAMRVQQTPNSDEQFREFLKSPEVVALAQKLSYATRGENINLKSFKNLQDKLRELRQNAVLLYPLILDDRLELVLIAGDRAPIHRSVQVNRPEMEKAIREFRVAVVDRRKRVPQVQKNASQFYELLIKPIENDLAMAKAQTIIYAPDGQLRYIPLAALFDGQKWLVQRFRINNITAASLTNFKKRSRNKPHILAGAFTNGNYNIQVGRGQFALAGLPFAKKEVENLAAYFPRTTKLLDDAFTQQATVPRMKDYNIVHFATHAAFFKGKPEDSFILFGDGSRATLVDVESWKLKNVDLVVLSACQTGVGGELGNGQEILGFGYQMQNAGAKAAIASLWSVDDGGTQLLMDAFYQQLKTGNVPKAEALRSAQIALISGNSLPTTNTQQPAIAGSLAHPYYWAPFILIGNGL